MNNVLFIVRKPECDKVEAYRVVSYKNCRVYANMLDECDYVHEHYTINKLPFMHLPENTARSAKLLIDAIGYCYVYYSDASGWEVCPTQRYIAPQEYYAGKYTTRDIKLIMNLWYAIAGVSYEGDNNV